MIREWNEESLDHRNTLLYAMGISEEDAKRPIIGLVNSWNEMNPGHFPFKDVIAEMKEEIYRAGGLALELPITGICDGICSNTPGDRYTLPARDMVSTEVETVAELNMRKEWSLWPPGKGCTRYALGACASITDSDVNGVYWLRAVTKAACSHSHTPSRHMPPTLRAI
jgi:hypothetical protein